MSNRLNRTTGQASSGSPGTQQHTHDLETRILMTLRDVKNVEKEKSALEAQCGALRHYMELIIKINCDLTNRLGNKEDLPDNFR